MSLSVELNDNQKHATEKLKTDFKDLCSRKKDCVGRTKLKPHQINMGGDALIRQAGSH